MKNISERVSIACICLMVVISYGLFASPSGTAREDYRVPVDPPKSHYIIDARIDLTKGAIEGRETIVFKNTSNGPIGVLAVDWETGPAWSISMEASGKLLMPLNPENSSALPSPLFYPLPDPLAPGKKLQFEVTFKKSVEFSAQDTELGDTGWYPRLWWDGLPLHDSFSVKLDIPPGFALAASGRLNPKTGRYENEGVRTFGIYLGKNMKTESREVEGVLITTLATEKGAKCAAVCLETAGDVIRFCREWLGFFPFKFLSIIPGDSSGRWGGYPFATGIVAIHGQETFKEDEPLRWWQHIISHEIGHEYWGEWVLDPDNPDWLWIGMGIMIDTEYMISRKLNLERRVDWMRNYLNGLRMYYDLTVDIPPAQVEKIQYDHNNTVIHSKGPSIIFALDSVLGRTEFEKIFKRCLLEYGGRRLGWKDFESFYEKETGQNLAWFFDQWVRSNVYLCYKIEAQGSRQKGNEYLTDVKVSKLGTMKMPVPVKAVFADGTDEIQSTDRFLDVNVLTFKSKAKLKEAVLDPEKKLAMLAEPLPKISEEAAEMLALGWRMEDGPTVYKKIKAENIQNSDIWYRLGMQLYTLGQYGDAVDCFQNVSGLEKEGLTKFAALGWIGLLLDLQGQRPEALRSYQEALKFDTGESMRHDQFKIQIDKKWLEERLKTPFTREK